jgi:phage baseplate assembly protein V
MWPFPKSEEIDMSRPEYGSDNPNTTWLNLIRSGTVYSRRTGQYGPEIQVYYPDRDLLTDFLPVNQMGSAGAAFHFCPRVGDNVTVLHLGTGVEQGIVLGSHGTNNNPSFIPNSVDSVALATEDGAFFEHEPQSGTFTLAGVTTFHLHVNGDSLSFVGGKWTLNIGGDCNLTAGGDANVTATNATVKAGSIKLDGNVTVTGDLTVLGTMRTKLVFADPHCQNLDGSGGGT